MTTVRRGRLKRHIEVRRTIELRLDTELRRKTGDRVRSLSCRVGCFLIPVNVRDGKINFRNPNEDELKSLLPNLRVVVYCIQAEDGNFSVQALLPEKEYDRIINGSKARSP